MLFKNPCIDMGGAAIRGRTSPVLPLEAKGSPPMAGLGPALARLSVGSNLISVEFFSH